MTPEQHRFEFCGYTYVWIFFQWLFITVLCDSQLFESADVEPQIWRADLSKYLARTLGTWDTEMELLGFSFCLIYPGLGSGKVSKPGNANGCRQKKKSLRNTYSLSNKRTRKGAMSKDRPSKHLKIIIKKNCDPLPHQLRPSGEPKCPSSPKREQ